MFKKVLSSLIVLGLLVCGVWLVGAKTKTEAKISSSSESGQSVSNERLKPKIQKPNIQKARAVRAMKLEEKVITPVFEMQIEEEIIDEEKSLSCPFYFAYPAWSPDNKKVAYVLVDGSESGGVPDGGQIWLRDLATMEDSSILIDIDKYEYGRATELDFSPDGKQIVCVLNPPYLKGKSRIPQAWKMDIDGKNKVKLTNFKEYNYRLSPKWSPDGKKILVCFAGGDIHLINPDGSGYTVMPTATKKGGGGLVP